MQSLPKNDIFVKAVSLFYIKLAEMSKEVDTFLEYFCVQKSKKFGFYEAIKGNDWCPIITNGIECINKLVYDDHTFRERWPIGRFWFKTVEIVERWSLEKKIPRITEMLKCFIRYR